MELIDGRRAYEEPGGLYVRKKALLERSFSIITETQPRYLEIGGECFAVRRRPRTSIVCCGDRVIFFFSFAATRLSILVNWNASARVRRRLR